MLQRTLTVVLIFTSGWLQLEAAGDEMWSQEMGHPIVFYRVLNDDLLLVGTRRHLFALHIDSGEVAWRLRNVSVGPEDALLVPESELLLVNEGWGGALRDQESNILALNARSGEIVWESDTIHERALEAVLSPDRRRLLIITALKPRAKKKAFRELGLILLQLEDGRPVWQNRMDDGVRLNRQPAAAEHLQTGLRSFDLAGYHSPRFHQGKIFLHYDGVRCYDAADGRLLWRREFRVFDGSPSRSYAEPFFDQYKIYVFGEGSLRAYSLRDGQQIWRSPKLGTALEMQSDPNRIYLQLGGHYFDFEEGEWRRKGPFGAAAVDRRNGRLLWKWQQAEGSLSNLMIFGDRVYLGDQNNLIALDRYTGTRLYRVRHRFAKPPQIAALNEQEQLVLIGDENVAGFRYTDGSPLWSHHLTLAGAGLWKNLAAGFLATTGAILRVASFGLALNRGLLPALPSPVNRLFNYRNRLIGYGGQAGHALMSKGSRLLQKSRFAQLDGTHQYYFAQTSSNSAALVGISLSNGRIEHQLDLTDVRSPLLVSESESMVFRVQGQSVTAYPLDRGQAPRLLESRFPEALPRR